MKGMNLKAFQKIMVNYDEIEFFYRDILYNFQKEMTADGKVKISVWQSGEKPKCCYIIEVENNSAEFEKIAKNLIKEEILFDKKSILEGESDISIAFFT